jgi:hypothetical protein
MVVKIVYNEKKSRHYHDKEGKMQGQEQNEEWITMAAAAKLFHVSNAKISRMAANKEIQTRENRRDKRVRLVNMNELRRYFESNPDVQRG